MVNRFGYVMVFALLLMLALSLYGQVYSETMLTLRATFGALLLTVILGIAGLGGNQND